jgi:hypothetical protein
MDRRGSLAKSLTAAQTTGMSTYPALVPRSRALLLSLFLGLALALLTPFGALAADPSAEPSAATSPSADVGAALCQSVDDLRLVVGFLRDTSISEDGVIPVVVASIAGLAEAHTLAGLVRDTYRPLVADLTAALQHLRTTIDELGGQVTVGAGVAEIGGAITDVGNAMDAIGQQLASCPAPSPAPVASADVGSPEPSPVAATSPAPSAAGQG